MSTTTTAANRPARSSSIAAAARWAKCGDAAARERRSALVHKYAAERRKGRGALESLRSARFAAEWGARFEWEEPARSRGGVRRVATEDRGGLTYRLEIIGDEDTRLDEDRGLGTVTEETGCSHDVKQFELDGFDFCPFCRPHAEARPFVYRDFHSGGRRGVWFTSDVTYKDQRDGYRQMKFGRAHADAEARRSMFAAWESIIKPLLEDSAEFVGVQVTVYCGDAELGGASVWGVEFDGEDYTYINETAAEMMGQALAEARHSIGEKVRAACQHAGELAAVAVALAPEGDAALTLRAADAGTGLVFCATLGAHTGHAANGNGCTVRVSHEPGAVYLGFSARAQRFVSILGADGAREVAASLNFHADESLKKPAASE